MTRLTKWRDRRIERPTRLMNRNFFLLWQGQFVSLLGGQVNTVALVAVVKQATGSASLIGLMMLMSSITRVLLSGMGGAWADRHSRRKIIVYSDLIKSLAVLSLAGLLYLAPHATGVVVAWLWGVGMCLAATNAFFTPAIAAAIPELVSQNQVAKANSLRQLVAQISSFVGQSLGGVLFRLWGAPLLVLINGLSFLYAAVSEFFVTLPQPIQHERGTWKEQVRIYRQDIMKGFLYVWHTPGLRRLFCMSALINIFTAPIVVLLPFYVEDYLKVELDWYGFLLATYSTGLMLGSFSAGFVKMTGESRGGMIIMFMILKALSLMAFGFTRDPLVAMICTFMIGATGGFNSTNIGTILQISTPSEMRGRVFGSLNTLTGSTVPLGMGLGGVLFDVTGQSFPLLYGICGGTMVVVSLWLSMNREFRKFLAYEPT